ncbi:MAG: hypothetical protein K2G44_00115 [Clostridia bacterium]|nr:hypothetical protein [Clostridia bacterium]
MVGKLMKHELKALFRGLLIIGIVVLVFAGIGRLLIATNPNGYIGVLFAIFAIYLSLIAIFAAYIGSIAQFSRSLFTGEGYMTFSLPVTPTQLIISKLLSALIATWFGVAVCAASCGIVLTAVPAEVMDEIAAMLGEVWQQLSAYFASDPLLVVELVLILISSIPMGLLLMYLIVSVGQLFTAHRKLITVAIAIGCLLIVFPILNAYCLDPILDLATKVSIHLADWIQILLYVGIDIGSFFAVRYILKNKVNLIV